MADVSRLGRATNGAAEQARDVEFPIALRGYDRQAVDEYVDRMAQLLDELETTQLRESVVQRALDEVGEQTSGILQRAHETAEEITARSRAKAEGRLQRAEREAEMLRREADEYAERVIAEYRQLWDERQRLIDDVRQLADEVLGVADDASERLPQPELLRDREPVPEPEDDFAAAVADPDDPAAIELQDFSTGDTDDSTAVIAAGADGPLDEPFDLGADPDQLADEPFQEEASDADQPTVEWAVEPEDGAQPEEALGEQPEEALAEQPDEASAEQPAAGEDSPAPDDPDASRS